MTQDQATAPTVAHSQATIPSNGAKGIDDSPLPNPESIHHHPPNLQYSVHPGKAALENGLANKVKDHRHSKHIRISRAVPMMRHEYDVVVIGSGYGGAVAASRMARATQTVCLLELGKERWPGEYPTDTLSALPELHITGDVEIGPELEKLNVGGPQGLYHLIVGENQNAFVANGLGGTSLLNANVFLKADHRTLSLDSFPPEIRNNPNNLDPYYERAEQVLQPERYPEHFPTLPKLEVLKKQAEHMGLSNQFYRVPQTTTFKDRVNNMGVRQIKSTLSGQDATGVNDGSKNSTLMNYLPDAWNHGAEIFCGCEVRYITPCTAGKNKWTVHFAWHGDKRGRFKDSLYSELMWVQAKKFVFLGAGAIGSTEILLRSRVHGLEVSSMVGKNMSGNGDMLGFGYHGNDIANAIGKEDPEYLKQHPVGPTINGIIDMRHPETTPNVLDGYVIEEGAIPEALAGVMQDMFDISPKSSPRLRSIGACIREVKDGLLNRLAGPWDYGSSLNRTMVYLIMSHDDNQATLILKHDKPYLQYRGASKAETVKKLTARLEEATSHMGAQFVNNPFMAKFLGKSEITVHPLGGANMSSDGTGANGVTNHYGEVFKGHGADVHEGLIVVDGAIIPTALAVNPFATITALAERSVAGIARANGIAINYDLDNCEIDWSKPKVSWKLDHDMERAQTQIAKSPQVGGVRFTEIMQGYVHIGGDILDPETAAEVAKGASSRAKFYLSVDVWDVDGLKIKNNHAAMLTGTFSCGALSPDPLMVLGGSFQLFSQDPSAPDTQNLVYDFDMRTTCGTIYHFHGEKKIDTTISLSMHNCWTATTTLYVTITHSEPTINRGCENDIVGVGILNLNKKNFAEELLTLRAIGESTLEKMVSIKKFLSYFAGRLSESFFTPFDQLQYPQPNEVGLYNKVNPTESITVTASDGVETIMQMWKPCLPGKCKPILLVPGASVDYQIFALPTIPWNFVDFLLEHGYTIYCINHRVGKTPVAKHNWTTYDARLDIAAATQKIRDLTGAEKIYAVVHCAGAIAMSQGLLDGTITGIGGLTASQVFMNPIFTDMDKYFSRIKSIPKIYEEGLGAWFDCVPPAKGDHPIAEHLIDELLRLYPVKDGEKCTSVVCHRTELVFGRLWTHSNLNEATHLNLDKFIGGVSMRNLEQLMEMGRNHHVVDDLHESLVTKDNIERLRDIPILFIQGEDNAIYDLQATKDSFDILREQLNMSQYERVTFEGRGHLDCWMSPGSFGDVYSRVEQHAEKTIAAQHLMGRE